MDEMIRALTAPFAAGFIVQRFLEILDPLTTSRIANSNIKKFVMGMASLALGLLISGFGQISIFSALCAKTDPCFNTGHGWDVFFTGIFISAGTEGFNSLMKFANYKKEASKADAARKRSGLTRQQLDSVNPQE